MHFYKHITYLGLPVEYKHQAILRDKLMALKEERKDVNTLCTSADKECALDYYRKITDTRKELSYL